MNVYFFFFLRILLESLIISLYRIWSTSLQKLPNLVNKNKEITWFYFVYKILTMGLFLLIYYNSNLSIYKKFV